LTEKGLTRGLYVVANGGRYSVTTKVNLPELVSKFT